MNESEQQKCTAMINHYLELVTDDSKLDEAWLCISERDRAKFSLEDFRSSCTTGEEILPRPRDWKLEFFDSTQWVVFVGTTFREVFQVAQVKVEFHFEDGAPPFERLFQLIQEADEWKIYEKSDLLGMWITEVRIGDMIIVHIDT